MMNRFDADSLNALLAAGKIKGVGGVQLKPRADAEAPKPKEKKHKYGAKKEEVDGIKFSSKREANRYLKLKYLQSTGVIQELRLQVPYELNPGGTFSYKYVADFVYYDVVRACHVVEDCKGFRTVEYKKKKKLMKKVHGVDLLET